MKVVSFIIALVFIALVASNVLLIRKLNFVQAEVNKIEKLSNTQSAALKETRDHLDYQITGLCNNFDNFTCPQ